MSSIPDPRLRRTEHKLEGLKYPMCNYIRDPVISVKPSIVYVDPVNGNDSNDGLSFSTAKLTMEAAKRELEEMKSMDDTLRKFKIAPLRHREILTWLANRGEISPDSFYCPTVCSGIPDGAMVHQVFYEPHRGQFAIVLYHEDFEEVPEGEAIPYLNEPIMADVRIFRTVGDNILSLDVLTVEQLKGIRDMVNAELYDREHKRQD